MSASTLGKLVLKSSQKEAFIQTKKDEKDKNWLKRNKSGKGKKSISTSFWVSVAPKKLVELHNRLSLWMVDNMSPRGEILRLNCSFNYSVKINECFLHECDLSLLFWYTIQNKVLGNIFLCVKKIYHTSLLQVCFHLTCREITTHREGHFTSCAI